MGVAEIQKMSPSTTGRCSRQGSGDRRQMGVWHGDMAANHTDLLYLTSRRGWKNYIRRPDMVERIGSSHYSIGAILKCVSWLKGFSRSPGCIKHSHSRVYTDTE